MHWRRGHKVPRDEKTKRKAGEGEDICTVKDNREGTKAMRKNSAASRVASVCHVNRRRLGKKDAGAEGQDNSIKMRGWIDVEKSDCVIECTRDVYLERVSHILWSRGFCSTCARELSLKLTIIWNWDTPDIYGDWYWTAHLVNIWQLAPLTPNSSKGH